MADPAPPTPHATARRVRAIWGYSLLEQAELAERAGIHPDRLRSLLGRTSPKQASPQELLALAEAADVPLSFAAVGFAAGTNQEMAQMWAEITRLRETVTELVGLLTGNPDARGSLLDEVVKTVERGLTRQAREAGRPSRRPASDPRRQAPPNAA